MQKNCKKIQNVYKRREEEFQQNLDNLFDIADALEMIKIEEDKIFLQKQWESGRSGCLAGVDKKLAETDERARLEKLAEEKYKQKPMFPQSSLPSVTSQIAVPSQ